MKRVRTLGVLIAFAAVMTGDAAERAAAPPKPAVVEDNIAVYFSPGGGAADALVHLISSARKSIIMEAFYFTHDHVIDAVIDAHDRGVDVEVLLDHETADVKGGARLKIRRAGITVYIGPEEMTMHNKVLIIDDSVLVTGSFNFTHSADRRNAENMLILKNKRRIIAAYKAYHRRLCKISKKYATEE